MAQIIKHRRGSITQLKDVTARISELVVATGSIGDLNGPFLFVGETEGVAGAYRSISKIYQGATAPTITVGSHGSVIDGTPFYASGNKSLYILSKDGNARLDFTGNIEGNTINNVTINSLTGSNANITSITGSNGNFTNLTGTTFTSTNSNITSLTGSNGNFTNLTGTTFTSTNSNITSLTGSNASVSNVTGGTLTVTGMTYLNNDLHITGNTYQTGSIDITGDITLGGNITIGNQTTDIIQFGGEVSSSILPIVHDSFDLGSPSKNWRNLHVSGTAYVNILEAQSISLDGITVFEDLVVSGSSYLGQGAGDQVVISGSIYNDQLTEKRLVVAGTNGLLTDYSGLTFDNGNLNLSGALEVTNIQGTGSLYLKADEADSRYFEIYNTAASDTHIKSNGGLSFFGDDTNYLKIDDNAGTATIVGVNGVFVSSSLSVTDSLNVTGSAEFKNNVGITGTLDVTGSATLKDNLSVSGTTTVSGATILQSTLTVDSTSELKGATTVNSTLDVTGSVTLKNSLSVSGATSFDNNVSLVGGDTLYVNHISDYGAGNLDITTSGDIVLESTSSLSIQLKTDNSESGVNYLNVNSGSVNFSTYDTGSGLTHKVILDNTGSLRFENVAIGITGSLGISGSLDVKEDVIVHRNLYVSGNLELLGTSSYVNISSSQVDLGTNIINLNTYAPFERFAGISVHDSGSSVGVTGSLLWDAVNNVWIYANPSGSNYASARFIAGPKNTGSLGDETGLTIGHFPIATGDDHISDSLLTYLGTTLAFNTNKFTIDSASGDTLVSGNFSLTYSGGTDNGSNTSAIMFRNSANVVGFISTTETEDVLDGVLGYKNSNGALVFSTVIDGGTY
jgi:cytoskeletal protein CcmA (bactofilin family)